MRLPARFLIRSGGTLDPRTVSGPAFVALSVTVTSGDGTSHRLVFHMHRMMSLFVPAGGRASIQIPGQRAGVYPIDVDGSARGNLLVGGEPGP